MRREVQGLVTKNTTSHKPQYKTGHQPDQEARGRNRQSGFGEGEGGTLLQKAPPLLSARAASWLVVYPKPTSWFSSRHHPNTGKWTRLPYLWICQPIKICVSGREEYILRQGGRWPLKSEFTQPVCPFPWKDIIPTNSFPAYFL